MNLIALVISMLHTAFAANSKAILFSFGLDSMVSILEITLQVNLLLPSSHQLRGIFMTQNEDIALFK